MSDIIEQLRRFSMAPVDEASFEAWLELHDAMEFLKENTRHRETVVYAGLRHVFIHAVGIPSSRVDPLDVDDILSWNFNAHGGSWGVHQSFDPPKVYITEPLADTSSTTFRGGTKLVFPRHFEGHLGEKHYFEVLQVLVHILGLHFVPERQAYCRLDEEGDLEDMIRIIRLERMATGSGGTVILFKREILNQWMTLTESVIVQTFEFTRFRISGFGGWTYSSEKPRTIDGDLMYRSKVEPGRASYARGVQVLRTNETKEALFVRLGWSPTDQVTRLYVEFLAFDFKNNVLREISTSPDATANYFIESDLPFEMSPVFFKPEVLQRYKADSDKYTLGDRSISCRGTWHLQTYDINAHGQVHTYIVYLRSLPYKEQLYWKAHNEAPKGPISKRAYKTDFKGEWGLDYDPLPSLRSILLEWDRCKVPWWTLRNAKLFDKVSYPVTSSADEWASELMNLDQLVVEGFEEKWLRRFASSQGRIPDPKFRSLKLLEECLTGFGYEVDHGRMITAPLHQLNELRTKLKGHASNNEAISIKREMLLAHTSYRVQFAKLCSECDDSIRQLDEVLKGTTLTTLDGC